MAVGIETKARVYCLSILGVVAVASFPLFLNYLYLRNSGEYLPVREIISRQQSQEGVLFGSAVFDHGAAYKFELYSRLHPKVIALGSSRVLQFRKRFFSRSFLNMGRAINYPREGIAAARELVENGPPKLILLGVDFWWFSPDFRKADETVDKPLVPEATFAVRQLLLPFEWIAQGKLGWRNYLNGICQFSSAGERNHGVMARMLRQGFGDDGSFYYTGIVTGDAPRDVQFKDTFSRIKTGSYNFSPASVPDEGRLRNFITTYDLLVKSGATVVLFAPPLAPSVYRKAKESGKLQIIETFIEALRGRGMEIHDFQNAEKSLGSSDAEFIDGFHGGDLTYAKLLLRLAEAEPERVAPFVNIETLKQEISGHADIAFLPDPVITDRVEVNFLQLGVEKPATIVPEQRESRHP